MAHGKIYTRLLNCKEWQELRIRKLRANPLCELCQKKGYIVSARVVHHIVEIESAKTEAECRRLAYSWGNLQALCYECHKQVHVERRSHTRDGHAKTDKNRFLQWVEKEGGNLEEAEEYKDAEPKLDAPVGVRGDRYNMLKDADVMQQVDVWKEESEDRLRRLRGLGGLSPTGGHH